MFYRLSSNYFPNLSLKSRDLSPSYITGASFTQEWARDGTGQSRDSLSRSSRRLLSRSLSHGTQEAPGQIGTRVPRESSASPDIYKFNYIKQKMEQLSYNKIYPPIKFRQFDFLKTLTVGGPLFCNFRTRKSCKIRGTLQNKGPVPLILCIQDCQYENGFGFRIKRVRKSITRFFVVF